MPDRPRGRSLRRHIVVVLLSVVTTMWVVAAAVSYVEARHEIAEVLDAHLAQTASLISVQWDGQTAAVDTEHAPLLHPYGRRVMFQIWQDATLRLHSAAAPNRRLSDVTEGFSNIVIDGAQWRVFSARSRGGSALVQVAEQYKDRDELTAVVAMGMIVPLAVALPLLAVAVWFAVGRTLRSLTHVSDEVTKRAPHSLAPIATADAPMEIEGLITNLNHLFGRVQASVERERQFTADAAHELRTPIAAIRAQAQVARSAATDAARAHALDRVIAGCDRATHTVSQMLTLARVSADTVRLESRRCELVPVVKDTLRDLAPAALEKNIDLALTSGPEGAIASGDAGLLSILVRNLVDNAIRYSPPGSHVVVRVGQTGAGAFVSVTDEGPGIPSEQREHIGRRFHRAPGTEAPGSGLGLSIVKRIVELHGGVLTLETAESGVGLRVRVSFPARPQ